MKDKERKRGAKATILHTGIWSHVFAPKVSYGYKLPPKFQAAAIELWGMVKSVKVSNSG